ncbi:hypothetical protein [Apilactobacillus micheneri]|uniref:hypothetical protein n=1 Tax=Apilactobacillus micheneri TaxID=1899430 RepID=UPI00112AE728|nr:hypothetical protein [Apilactobacillus micheneri]TPR40434.1 hypothetical protein DY119_01720 [Apilactobacillus micheneri]
MLTTYRMDRIPRPIDIRDKRIAYLEEKLNIANKVICGQSLKIEGLKNSRNVLLKDNNYWHGMYKDLQDFIKEVSQ